FAKAFVLVQLSMLLVSTSTVLTQLHNEALPPHPHGASHYPALAPSHPQGHHHIPPPLPHHGHPHAPAPAPYHHPPTHAPAPAHPLPRPPFHFPRTLIAVQGVVYCKSCKYAGVDTLLGAAPVSGATVKLQCNNTKYPKEILSKTDKNGYFFVVAPKTITNYGAHKCKVSLVSSHIASCSKPSNLHYGLQGSPLRPEKPFTSDNVSYVLYTVGPFAFEPKCPL
ncbi:LOW QUALITY PROTEIN: Pollen_Ole_e_I domain-containing protein, partial [Cephalotus follicularis]